MAGVYVQANHDENGNLDNLSDKSGDPQLFRQSILRIRENALKIEDHCKSLIKSVSRINWGLFDENQLEQIFELLKEVFIAHPYTVEIGIEGVIVSFYKFPLSHGQDIVLECISNFLIYAMKVSPISKIYIFESLTRNIPFPNRPKFYQMNFYKLSFILAMKLPKMRKNLCEIVIKGLIKVDVELPNDKRSYIMKILKELREKNIPVEQVLNFYIIDQNTYKWIQLADKYDEILAFTFEKFQTLSKLCRKEKISLYECLQSGFSKVLSCRGLVAVHFIWFYLASIHKKFRRELINELWEKFCNPVEYVYVRHTCMTYLGGIFSRGLFIKPVEFSCFLDKLIEWIQTYLSKNTASTCTLECTNNFSFSKNHLLYVACQSLFYCIIFHSNTIQKNSDEADVWKTRLNKLDLEKIFFSPLNPIYYCSAKVVEQIAHVGRDYEIFYIYQIITRNSKISKPINSNGASEVGDEYLNMVDLNKPCNFPFDPYVMLSTKDLITPIYKTWKK